MKAIFEGREISDRIAQIVLIFMGILVLWTAISYAQKILLLDSAFVLFKIINGHNFYFSEYRYGAFVTQSIPLIGSLLHLPLWILELSYALSFYTFYLIVAALVHLKYRQTKYSLLLAFYLCLMVSDSFYWSNNEVHQGIAWLMLFLGKFFYHRTKKSTPQLSDHLLMLIILFMALISHPLVIPVALFLWCYPIFSARIDLRIFRSQNYSLYSIVIIAISVLRYYLSLHGWYDSEKLDRLQHDSSTSILTAIGNAHSADISRLLFQNYWLMIPIGFIGYYNLIRKRFYYSLAYSIAAGLLLYLLICSVFPVPITRDNLFYFESEWQSFSLICATPYVFSLFSKPSNIRWHLGFIALIFFVRFIYIAFSFQLFDDRLQNLEILTRKLHDSGQAKTFASIQEFSKEYFLLDWGIPVETILMSDRLGLEEYTCLPVADMHHFSNSNKILYTSFDSLDITTDLNTHYFLVDTIDIYHPISPQTSNRAIFSKLF